MKNYKQFNEGLNDLLKGPSKEEVWKNLGYEKTYNTPEEFFLKLIDGLEIIKIKKQRYYPESVFWGTNGELLFEQYKKDLLFCNDKIFDIYEKVFNMTLDDIIKFIKIMVEKHLNWNGFTPVFIHPNDEIRWGKY